MNFTFDSSFKIYSAIFLSVFFLIIREAILLPLTHDEYSTIMVSYQPIMDILTYKDPIPNNHILNTLLLKLDIITFGDHIFTNRLHNVLFFIPFFYFTVLLARKVSKNLLLQVLFVSILVLQPFLLDFFCITRGYGLSITLQIISLYYGICYIQENKSVFLLWSTIMGAFGVYANFTLLNYYIPLCGVLTLYSFLNNYKVHQYKLLKEITYLFSSSAILGVLCYLPFSKMVSTNQFVFWSSNNFFTDTIVPLTSSLRVGVSYFKWDNIAYASVIIGFILIILFLAFIVRKKLIFQNKLFIFSLSLLLLVILYNNLQFYLVNIPFLNARTSLFFVPLITLLLFTICAELHKYSKKLSSAISIFLIILCTQHFVRGYDGRVNYEWYFDQNTYNFLDEVMYQINTNNLPKPVLVDCHWFYHPSLTYHINQDYKGIIELVPYHKETNINSGAIFYFSEPNEADLLSENFDKIKDFAGSYSILWKHK